MTRMILGAQCFAAVCRPLCHRRHEPEYIHMQEYSNDAFSMYIHCTYMFIITVIIVVCLKTMLSAGTT